MKYNELEKEYFKWMCDIIGCYPYEKLLRCLHNIDFTYIIAMDGNRAEDGIDLRYRFGYEYDIDEPEIATYLDYKPCSVLEMLVALAMRCEENIMHNPELGNRTANWFWKMVRNLGLYSMDDMHFDDICIKNIVKRFLNREYKRNGDGGLFIIPNCRKDLRTIEIWCQAMWYLNEEIKQEEV